MTHIESVPRHAGTWGTWQSILLGLVLVLAGLVVLHNATAATVASTFIFGIVLLATGMLFGGWCLAGKSTKSSALPQDDSR